MAKTQTQGQVMLESAKKNKADEFYTQLSDIEAELQHYTAHFRGKVVLCNCDDPYESNFFKYFAMNFNFLGLKKLVATCYDGSTIAGEQLSMDEILGLSPKAENERRAFCIEIAEVHDANGDGAEDLADVEYLLCNTKNALRLLEGNGDFRSDECIALLREADIVVTNPPFSLFREYVAQLMEYGKQFLIIGNVNAITYKEIFPYIMRNELWMGQSIHSGDREFRVPEHYPLEAAGCRVDENGFRYIRVKGVRWFTNMDYPKRHEPLTLYKRYKGHEDEFPKYDNYDAIEISKTADIPFDYDGAMGVPITYLDKHCYTQFAILAITQSWNGNASKIYPQQTQVSKNGSKSKVSKLNDGAAIKVDTPPHGEVYYIVGDEYFIKTYCRIIIQQKQDSSGE